MGNGRRPPPGYSEIRERVRFRNTRARSSAAIIYSRYDAYVHYNIVFCSNIIVSGVTHERLFPTLSHIMRGGISGDEIDMTILYYINIDVADVGDLKIKI